MKVLLLSAYAARSHVHWQCALQAMFAHWQWRVLTLPPRHFSWRVRGNALYWSIEERPVLEDQYDLLVATSMVDLATLRGLVPKLTNVPTALYFHENQFDYPRLRQQHALVEAQMTSIYSALAADSILFNSHYNRDSFTAGCAALLRKLPDRVPAGVLPALLSKSAVLPVPYDVKGLDSAGSVWPGMAATVGRKPLRLLWVGRFEHDKGADGLLRILQRLERAGLDYELAVTGQQFRQSPPAFAEIQSAFGHRLVHFGYLESAAQYRALLQAADVVLSTAVHEFQGLAVMEAVACKCLPAVPGRLVYPEIYAARFCYSSHPGDPDKEADAATALVLDMAQDLPAYRAAMPDLSDYSMRHLGTLYEKAFHRTLALQRSH